MIDAPVDSGAFDVGTDASDGATPDVGGPDAAMDASLDAQVDAGPCESSPRIVGGGGFSAIATHATSPMMVGVGDLTTGFDGDLFAHDVVGLGASGDRIIRLGSDGSVSVFATPADSSFCTANQLAFDPTLGLVIYDIPQNSLIAVDDAGAVATTAPTLGLSGGGSCTDTGVIGLTTRSAGGFWVGSPAMDRLYAFDAGTRTEIASVTDPFRIEEAPDGSVYVLSEQRILHVTTEGASIGTVEVFFDAAPWLVSGLEVGPSGEVWISAVRDGLGLVAQLEAGASTLVAECIPGIVTDVELATSSSGSGTSLYVPSVGASVVEHDDDDVIYEITR